MGQSDVLDKRILTFSLEIYLDTPDFSGMWDQALNPKQPFVLGNGDTLGCSYHADYASADEEGSERAHIVRRLSAGKRASSRRSWRSVRSAWDVTMAPRSAAK
jgi:hypothetical protein